MIKTKAAIGLGSFAVYLVWAEDWHAAADCRRQYDD